MLPATQIKRTQRYLRATEAQANTAVRKYLRRIRKARSVQELGSLNDLRIIIRDLAVISYARGYQSRVTQFKPVRLSHPSPFKETVDGLQRLLVSEGLGTVIEDLDLSAYAQLQSAEAALQTHINAMLQASTTEEVRAAAASYAAAAEARVKTVVRTMSHTAHNAAHYVADQDPAIQEILWGYKYVTAGDERVREEHIAMDGVTAAKNDPIWDIWWPPNGWNCRCILVSVFESEKPVGPQLVDGGQPMPDPGFVGNPATLLGV